LDSAKKSQSHISRVVSRMPPKINDSRSVKNMVRIREAKLALEVARQVKEAELEAKKQKNIKDAEARRESTPSLQMGLSSFLSKPTTCVCDGCKNVQGSVGVVLTTAMIGAKGDLKNKPEVAKELSLHSLDANGSAPELKERLKKLVKEGAYRLSGVVAPTFAAAPAAAAVESPAMGISPPPSPERPSATGYSPDRKKGRYHSLTGNVFSASTPQEERETRQEKGKRTSMEADQRPRPDVPWPEDLSSLELQAKLQFGFRCVIVARIQRYGDYVRACLSAQQPPMSKSRWSDLTDLFLHIAEDLLDDFIEDGIRVSGVAHAAVRDHSNSDWREYYPQGHHVGFARVVKSDAAWCTVGYTSPHGVAQFQCGLTQLLLAVCHLTKEADTARGVLHRPGRFVCAFMGASGDMDEAGARVNAATLMAKAWEAYWNAIYVEDGDSKGVRPTAFHLCTSDWVCGKCKCHKAKNARGACKGAKMSSITCKCMEEVAGRVKACTNETGFRFKDSTALKVSTQYYRILFAAVEVYMPEMAALDGVNLPPTVGAADKEVLRQKAIKGAFDELTIMVEHLCGGHALCTHEDLPANYPVVQCLAQRRRLAEVVVGLQGCLGDVLTPMGLLDINSVESQHAVLRIWREKGIKWGAAQCFLGECMGFLDWQELMLAFWGKRRDFRNELADKVKAELGVDVGLTEKDLAGFKADLEKRLGEKEARSGAHAREVRAAWRKKSVMSQADQRAAATYKTGGSEAAVDADLEQALLNMEMPGDNREHTAEEMTDMDGDADGYDMNGDDEGKEGNEFHFTGDEGSVTGGV